MKHIYSCISTLVILIFFVPIISGAQNVGVIALEESTLYIQEYHKLLKTSDGGILAIGVVGQNGRITKFNSSYTSQWSIGFDSIPMKDVIETNDGNYVVMGYSLKTTFQAGAFVIKLNNAGTILFQKMYYSAATNNQFTSEGLCKGAGTDNGFVLFGGNCIAMDYMVKCDVNGDILWSKQYSGTGNGFIGAMISETNGYVADFYLTQLGVQSVGIIKMDALGNVLWCKVMQSANNVALYSNSLIKKNSGDYYIWTSPSDVYGAQNYTINSSGTTITCKRQVNPVMLEITSIMATGNTNDEILFTAGLTPGYSSYFKLDASDNIVYQKQSNTMSTYFYNAMQWNNGTYMICGGSGTYGKILAVVDENSNGVCSTTNLNLTTASHTFNITSPTLTSYLVPAFDTTISYLYYTVAQTQANLCGSLSTNDLSISNAKVEVYPNPATESITVSSSFQSSEQETIIIIDITGREVLRVSGLSGKENKINTSELQNGVYIIRVLHDNEEYRAPLIIGR